MSSQIKADGKVGAMLTAIANRGGQMTTDRSGFPPSRVMFPLRRRGLVAFAREDGAGRVRYNVWRLTAKGWAAIGRQPEAR